MTTTTLTGADLAIYATTTPTLFQAGAMLHEAGASGGSWRALGEVAVEHYRASMRPVRVLLAPGVAPSAGNIMRAAFAAPIEQPAELAPVVELEQPRSATESPTDGGLKVRAPTPPPVQPSPSTRASLIDAFQF